MTPTVTSPGRGARATATGARRRGDARSAEPDAAAGDCGCWDSLMPELSVAGSLRWLGAPESSTLNSSKKLVTDSECQHFTSVEFRLTRTESCSCPVSDHLVMITFPSARLGRLKVVLHLVTITFPSTRLGHLKLVLHMAHVFQFQQEVRNPPARCSATKKQKYNSKTCTDLFAQHNMSFIKVIASTSYVHATATL